MTENRYAEWECPSCKTVYKPLHNDFALTGYNYSPLRVGTGGYCGYLYGCPKCGIVTIKPEIIPKVKPTPSVSLYNYSPPDYNNERCLK